ncbi:MAG: DNA-3-methyladenine glycosylase [Eubacteriaceae bacterium]|nr:DNA-3-methyladenine glycosylase [Eubacteriaceae bacterium]
MILGKEFYQQDTLSAAEKLLGKVLVFKGLKVRITETEAYIGRIDKAAHCYGNKKTKRTEVMFLEGGCSYIYLIYGMYYCLNIVTEKAGEGCAVLIRAAEPLEGYEDQIFMNRYGISREIASKYQIKNLMNGPGKLCRALGISKEDNNVRLTLENDFYVEVDGFTDFKVHISPRINIDYAMEAKDFPWRFFIERK